MATSLYCRKCGTRLSLDTQFCSTCGMPQTGIPHNSTLLQPEPPLFDTGMLPPTRLLNQRYRLIETVGRGGMGAVYSAQDTQLGDRLVALKEMSVSRLNPQDLPLVIEQFRREAHLLASLHHPHLPAIHEYFAENGRWYLVMSFIEGQNLQTILNATAEKRLPVNEVIRIGMELCDVLEYLHTHEPPIIFRDLKPQNIMITPRGHICLIDFGIARHFKQEQVSDTALFYSVGYAPPEQYGQSQTSPRSDIYSLGATLHQMLSGRNPSHQPFQFLPLHLVDPLIPLPLATLITQMVEMDAQKRPSHVAQVKQQLGRLLIPGPDRLTPGTLDGNNHLWLRDASLSASHTSPTSLYPPLPPMPQAQEERLKARPLARRSILIGLLGGIAVAGSGAFALNRLLVSTTAGSSTPTPVPAHKPTPTPTPILAANTISWTAQQLIEGQSSKAAPALAASANGTLHMVFVSNNDFTSLLYISSPDHGTTWANYHTVADQLSKATPALTIAPNGTLYLVFVADNDGNGLLFSSSQDHGTTWANGSPIPEQSSKVAPTLTIAPNGTFYVVYVANNDSNALFYTSSPNNGTAWTNGSPIPGQSSKATPALTASSAGTLHLIYVANDASNRLLYTSSQDNGTTWGNISDTGQTSLLTPALIILNTTLFLAFVSDDGSNQLYIISSQDGGMHWTDKQKIGQTSLLPPALTVLNNTLYLAFVANDGTNQLCTVSAK